MRSVAASLVGLAVFAGTTVAVSAFAGAAEAPTAGPGFTLTVFGHAPPGATRPDSLALVGSHVWVAYGGLGKPDGSGGAISHVVEFDAAGSLLRDLTVVGHNDGLRLDPATHKLWAIQNEDGNANVVMIDPASGAASPKYVFSANTHGGGYDDVAFIGGVAYVSASNPSVDNGAKNPGAAVVRAVVDEAHHTIMVTPHMAGALAARDIASGKTTALNLTDPDSLAVSPDGELILDSQGDGMLLWTSPTAPDKPVAVLPLQGGVQVDDTAFVSSRSGYLLFTDTKGEAVYKLSAPSWTVGQAYSASTGVEASASPPTPAVPASIGELDLKTGVLKPVAEHLVGPHGMIFVATR